MRIILQILLFCTILYGEDAQEAKIEGEIKVIHVLSDKSNKYAPEDGSAYLLKLKYISENFYENLHFGIGAYVNGDTGLTDWEGKNNALGLFSKPKGETSVVVGELYLHYKNTTTDATLGRGFLDTPLTKISTTLTPNFYQAVFLENSLNENISLSLGHINAISFGSQGATDWALVGEQTKTAGAAVPMKSQSINGVEQAKFIGIAEAAGGEDSKGISFIGLDHQLCNSFSYRAWNYTAYDFANSFYMDATYKTEFSNLAKLSFGAQLLAQKSLGKNYGNIQNSFFMGGVEAKIADPITFFSLSVNKSNDAEYFNAWGADPAYTSSIFSRNVYRRDVWAYKTTLGYTLSSKLSFLASFAYYEKSKTIGWGTLTAAKAAYESDLVIGYKPVKNLTLKLVSFIKRSEYDGVAAGERAEKQMNNISVIASYLF
jgi:hypothetical protein